MKHLTSENINELNSRKRANPINSISGYKSANSIGTISDSGVTNSVILVSVAANPYARINNLPEFN